MSIALSTLAIILFLIPGIIYRRTYFSSVFSREFFLQSPFQFLVHTFPASLLIHAIGLSVLNIWIKIDYESILNDAIKPSGDDYMLIHNWAWVLLFYSFGVNLIGWSCGKLMFLFVRGLGLDKRTMWCRFNSHWHYILSGEKLEHNLRPKDKVKYKVDLRYIDALVCYDEHLFLYRGMISGYHQDKKGDLKYFVLENAARKTINVDKSVLSRLKRSSESLKAEPSESERRKWWMTKAEAYQQSIWKEYELFLQKHNDPIVELGLKRFSQATPPFSPTESHHEDIKEVHSPDGFYKINGSFFLLPLDNILNLNVIYYEIIDTQNNTVKRLTEENIKV